MDTLFFYWLSPFIFLTLAVFLSIRLKFFSSGEISGRIPFFFGIVLLLLSICWSSLTNLTEYSEWFIPSAYSVISIIHFVVIIIGAVLTVIGLVLFADYWQSQKEMLTVQEQKISLLSELQRDAREPYHLMELFNLSLKEIVASVDETVGAVFLMNRSSRQLVLVSSVGLSKNDTAHLEQYPLGQNLITQSIELGESMVSGHFQFVDRAKQVIDLKYSSSLVLPMISGREKIGAIVLLAEQKQYFSRTEIKYLSPIAEWLAEKVKSTKLTRELALLTKEKDQITKSHDELNQRLFSTTASLHSSEVIESYCRSLVGIVQSKSVHLYGIKNGSLHFYGGSEPILDLSENYKTALIDALDKKKPIIINQETATDEGQTYIAKSSLIVPIVSANASDSLLFVKDSKAFTINDTDLKTIEIYANLSRLALQRQESLSLNITRRKGLEKIISLLRFENSITFEKESNYFVNHMSNTLPQKTLAVTFEKQTNGLFKAHKGFNIDEDVLRKFEILPGEGFLGNMNASLDSIFIFGKTNVKEAINAFDEHNRSLFYTLLGERGLPSFVALCPLYNLDGLVGASLFCMFTVSEEEKGEWQKLLTLASGLYSIRLTINQLKEKSIEVSSENNTVSQQLGRTVNRLNNHLSAIIGNAELISAREDLTGDIKNYFQTIVNESEQAAQFLRDSIGKFASSSENKIEKVKPTANLLIHELLKKSYISENIYQLGGSPREVNIALGNTEYIELSVDKFNSLFEAVINRFAVTVAFEDVISIATYVHEDYLYLDISSHHKNFPPIQKVSDIGEYHIPAQAIENRPADRFLEYISGENCYYAYDRFSQIPTYLSFKFKVSSEKSNRLPQQHTDIKSHKILAIDDQTVILDLITAMCQNLGYQVDIADSGEKGLEMALAGSYQLILTDLAMPGISGLDVAREIRLKTPNIPIVLITGWEVNLSEEQLSEAGISKVLYKPFRIEQLIEIMHSYLNPGRIST